MNDSKSARTAARPPRSTILMALAVIFAAIIGALGYQSLAAPPSSATHDARARSIPATPATVARQADDVRRRRPSRQLPPIDSLHGDHHGAPDEAGGAVPDGVTVFDDEYPGVANLDPDLLQALREAATDAADDGVTFSVTSGWRSPQYQNQLLREAVTEYGSEHVRRPHTRSKDAAVTSTLGICQPRPVDLRPPTLQTIPEAIDKNIAIARAR